MNSSIMNTLKQRDIAHNVTGAILAAFFTFFASFSANADPYQRPLFLGGGNVPGNLVLVPSVEWPTIVSVANLGDYTSAKTYAGYFDPKKCYDYSYSATESERHFYPSSTTNTRTCSGRWSGNFLNWAATQTIDPFRSALTGGYRVKDTPTETWLEKARHDGQGGEGIYPNRRLPNSGSDSAMVQGATPFNRNSIQMRIQGLGNKMNFKLNSTTVDSTGTPYNPANVPDTDHTYEISIRVKVCNPSVGLETNCRQYSQGWKPQGLLQQYANDIRYSVFGYLNHSVTNRDGGVLRAPQKFIGPTIPGRVEVDNPNKEWNPVTGVLIRNPNPPASIDAADLTTILDSGVINYLNRFGQMTTQNHKSYDPVSELFYSAVRYLKNQGNVPEYTAISGDAQTKFNMADGFPVITNWTDPIQHWCQPNVLLGIGDVYTHRDKNLPGSTGSTTDEPTKPAAVSADNTVNVNTATQKVAQLENITISTPFTGRENSAYMVGLAYDSHTKDMRTDLPGKQTASTYWVDVLEAQSLEPIRRNQYWLATKYGGFKVPDNFDPYARTTALPLEWWHTNVETLTSFGSRGDGSTFPRADNYFTAGEANAMVESLAKAFAKISSELVSASATAVATDSTRIEAGTVVYQARLDSRDWSGQLVGFEINPDGSFGAVQWDTDTPGKFLSPANRKVYTISSGSGVKLQYDDLSNLSSTQQASLLGADDVAMGKKRLNWLLGDASQEGAPLRSRNKFLPDGTILRRVLGDIVNSDPIFVDKPKTFRLPESSPGKNDYSAFVSGNAARRKMLYVGANDGMLHAFDADTGIEQFAYIPNAVFPKLASLTDPNYTHRYFVDGSPTVGDAYVNNEWRSMLVGTLGAGGRAVFALDVTDPDDSAGNIVRWEFTDTDLGYMIGQMSPKPIIGCLRDGASCKWVAIFGNGYQSRVDLIDPDHPELGTVDKSKAYLYVVDLNNPYDAPIKIAAGDEIANGLSAPVVLLDNEQTIIAAYAGDLQGNLWKFDLTNNSSQRLFKTPRAVDTQVDQPITAAPEVALHPVSGYMVYFGTGRYFLENDHTSNIPVQSLYGIWDKEDNHSTVRSELQVQTIIGGERRDGNNWRLVSNNEIDWNTKRGWYLNLIAAGERVTDAPVLNLGRAIFATRVPNETDDPCNSSSGTSWVMAVDMETGGRPSAVVFDVNRDRQFTDADNITITVNGQEITVVVSGFETVAAGMSRVTLAVSDRGVDILASGIANVTTTASSVNASRDAAIAKNAASTAAAAAAAAAAAGGGNAAAVAAAVAANAAAAANAKNAADAAAAAAGGNSAAAAKAAAAAAVAAAAAEAAAAAAAAANAALNAGGNVEAILTAIPLPLPITGGTDDVGSSMSYQIGRGSWQQLR